MAWVAGSLPSRLEDDGDMTIWKDGVWHFAGECSMCGDIGPFGVNCIRCTFGQLYGRPDSDDPEVVNFHRLGSITNLFHTLLSSEPDYKAAHTHFLLLLASLWSDGFPQHAGD